MNSRPSFSLGRALSAAFASLPAAWTGAWAALVLLWAANAFLPQLMSPSVLGGIALPVVAVLTLVLQFVACGALYRISLFGRDARKEGLGFGGLQLGLPELRLFLAELIVGLFGLLIAAGVFVVFIVAFNLAGMAEGHADTLDALKVMFDRRDGKDWIFIGYLIGAWIFLIFVNLKFSLMRAATVAQRKVVTLNALGLSSGNVGKLFIGLIALILPFFIAAIGLSFVGAHGFAFGHSLPGHAFAHHLLLALAVFLLMPVMIGFLSSAYGQIVASRTR